MRIIAIVSNVIVAVVMLISKDDDAVDIAAVVIYVAGKIILPILHKIQLLLHNYY